MTIISFTFIKVVCFRLTCEILFKHFVNGLYVTDVRLFSLLTIKTKKLHKIQKCSWARIILLPPSKKTYLLYHLNLPCIKNPGRNCFSDKSCVIYLIIPKVLHTYRHMYIQTLRRFGCERRLKNINSKLLRV